MVVTSGKGKKLVRTSENQTGRCIDRLIFLSLLRNVSSTYSNPTEGEGFLWFFAHVLPAPKTVSNVGQITINIC